MRLQTDYSDYPLGLKLGQFDFQITTPAIQVEFIHPSYFQEVFVAVMYLPEMSGYGLKHRHLRGRQVFGSLDVMYRFTHSNFKFSLYEAHIDEVAWAHCIIDDPFVVARDALSDSEFPLTVGIQTIY